MIIVVDFSSISNQINHKFKLIKSKMILQKSTTIIIAFIFTVLIQNCFSLPEGASNSCSSSSCKSCLDSCDSCDQCGLCTLCLGSKIGPCSQCQFCKGGLLDARKFAKKEKILPFAKPASQIVRDVSRDGPFKNKINKNIFSIFSSSSIKMFLEKK